MRCAGVNFDLATLDIATVTERTLAAPVVNVGLHLGVPAKAANGFLQPMRVVALASLGNNHLAVSV
jgi:hypothetical protein